MDLLTSMSYWGLSYDDIVSMFALTPADLEKKVLNCMGTPSSFTSTARQKKQQVVTCNDVYGSDKDELKKRAVNEIDKAISFIEDNSGRFLSKTIGTPEAYKKILQANIDVFLKNYQEDSTRGLYSCEALPVIAFGNHQFDIVLCPHFLFSTNPNFSTDFHLRCITEMCRVGEECRVFPLLDTQGNPPANLQELMQQLIEQGYKPTIETVAYELQKGGNKMLKVVKGH